MITELQNKYDNLLSLIESESKNKNKVVVLMNNHISGFISSKLALNKFGKENVINVIIPCYSDADYLIKSASFSKENDMKSKVVPIKDLYDDIMEPDFKIDVEIDITNFLKEQLMDVIALENNALMFSIVKEYQYLSNDTYVFKIIDINFNDPTKNVFRTESWKFIGTEEDLIEIAKYLEIDV